MSSPEAVGVFLTRWLDIFKTVDESKISRDPEKDEL